MLIRPINQKFQRRTLRLLHSLLYTDIALAHAEKWEDEILKLTPQERVDRLVKEFGWTETDAWNFLETLIEDDDE